MRVSACVSVLEMCLFCFYYFSHMKMHLICVTVSSSCHDFVHIYDVILYIDTNCTVYGVATISRLLKIKGLFCKILSLL